MLAPFALHLIRAGQFFVTSQSDYELAEIPFDASSTAPNWIETVRIQARGASKWVGS
jgi:hypothetical protein